jgi:inner membrane protein
VLKGSGMLAPMLSALHFLTHIGLGWIIANLWPATRRDRWLIVLAGAVPDLDGAGIVWSEPAYLATHRILGHCLVFGLLLLVITLGLADAPWPTAALVAVSFHVHLALDAVGTGGLPIRYLWPFSDRGWSYTHWTLASWQNGVVMALTLLGVLLVGRGRRGGTR